MKNESIWAQTNLPVFDPLYGDIETDVLIIGGGIAGLLCAFQLMGSGLDVTLIEAQNLLRGVTQNTTAKITSQHDLIYDHLSTSFSPEWAKLYAAANENAILEFEQIVAREHIDCGFERLSAFVYTRDEKKLSDLEKEESAARAAGIDAQVVSECGLPFSVAGALEFRGQAQYHPLRFLARIVQLVAQRCHIHENTPALPPNEGLDALSGEEKGHGRTPVGLFADGVVKTPHGSVKAAQIIVCTHYPFISSHGLYAARLTQDRSYVIALRDAPKLPGMYIDLDPDGYSLRSVTTGGAGYVLFGGCSHKSGHNREGGCYERLEDAARIAYCGYEPTFRWSAQDCMTPDRLPFVGQYAKDTPNLYVATGFNKWGMSTSMAASRLLADLLTGRDNPLAKVFSPQRASVMQSAPGVAASAVDSVAGLSKSALYLPFKDLEAIPNGHGGIVRAGMKKIGVYKTEDGTVFAVETACAHLGCQVEWNPDEKTWDCPCHGSRFDVRGGVISGPAQAPLKQVDVQTKK